MARDEDALRTAVEQSAAVLIAAGFPKMPARVLMTLLVSDDDGLTASELAETLGVSAAAISGAVRYLQTFGAIRRIARSGSRRDRYELVEDTWYTASLKTSPMYARLAALAENASAAIGEPASAAKARVDEMARFYRFLDARLPELMAEWEEQRLGR
ncbi:GbsR/MarR family transcriptional regulator [Herbiconiux daphne]|uniref:MarR family transcriptional regulator n=1 Tax=Herbiconiux daphne TaxID=2970914 RepID=A0ABT2GWJ6_9MICO|nr:MarR family transcriptional regulator [Herbiconiux daphne]MCS5732332.1 MarR family transcriptional regulator [Herbiconiux daphne]